MPAQISQTEIQKAVLRGIVKAHKSYSNLSGGNWLDVAPEYYVTSKIADSIGALEGSKYIYLERNVYDVMEESGAISAGRYKEKARVDGRADIVMSWGSSDTPRAIVEVKSPVYGFSQIENDLHRITHLLEINNDNSSLQFGIMAFYLTNRDGKSRTAKESIENRLNNIAASIKGKFHKDSFSFKFKPIATKVYKEDDCAWSPNCIVITKK